MNDNDQFLGDAISLSKAAEICPGKPNITTLWRWCRHGCRGVRLDSFVRGGRRFTTAEALARFIQATTAVADSRTAASPTPAPTILSKTRQKQLAMAEAYCKTNGI